MLQEGGTHSNGGFSPQGCYSYYTSSSERKESRGQRETFSFNYTKDFPFQPAAGIQASWSASGRSVSWPPRKTTWSAVLVCPLRRPNHREEEEGQDGCCGERNAHTVSSSKAHIGCLVHCPDHPGHHCCHDNFSTVPSNCCDYLQSTDPSYTQWSCIRLAFILLCTFF